MVKGNRKSRVTGGQKKRVTGDRIGDSSDRTEEWWEREQEGGRGQNRIQAGDTTGD
jgi:hypothetical protein